MDTRAKLVTPNPPASRRHLARSVRVGVLLLCLLVVALKLGTEPPAWLMAGTGSTLALVAACVIYAVLLVVPFIPSVEIGLLIMVLFGGPGAIGAYLATLVGLNLAYLLGRQFGKDLAVAHLANTTTWRSWPRVQRLMRRVTHQHDQSGRRQPLAPVLGLAVLLNLPANTVLGGGGGIALLFGAARVLSWPRFAATVAAATVLLPALVLLGIVGAKHV